MYKYMCTYVYMYNTYTGNPHRGELEGRRRPIRIYAYVADIYIYMYVSLNTCT